MKPKAKLNPRQEAFCRAYAGKAWGNAAEAYRLAGYRPKTSQSAAVCADKLLRIANIKEFIRELRADVEAILGIDRREALEILARIANGRLSGFLNDDGTISLQKVRDSGQELQEYVEESLGMGGVRRKIKLRDPVVALERLAKMMGWELPDKLDVRHSGEVEHRWTFEPLKGGDGTATGQ